MVFPPLIRVCLTKVVLHKNKAERLSFRGKRSEIEKSAHYITAMQLYRVKSLRLALLAQDDSLFFIFCLKIFC